MLRIDPKRGSEDFLPPARRASQSLCDDVHPLNPPERQISRD